MGENHQILWEKWHTIKSPSSHSHGDKMDPCLEEAVQLLLEKKAVKVLDLGCGGGRHLFFLSQQGFEVLGMDCSSLALEEVGKKAEDRNIAFRIETGSVEKIENQKGTDLLSDKKNNRNPTEIRLLQGSIYERLPFDDNFFDGVISTRVIHHGMIEEVRFCIGEIERILKPGGILLITVPTPKDPHQARPSREIAPYTYIPLEGDEEGIPHYLFDEERFREEFKRFAIHNIWVDSPGDKCRGGYFCLLGEKK